MAMVFQSAARRHHRSRIAYTFGLLALLGAATALVVVVRAPALSSTTRLTAPVPAPEITVVDVDEDPPDGVWNGSDDLDASNGSGVPEAAGGPTPTTADALDDTAQAARPAPDDVRRSLFWSGVFGLAISLAGLGLVGTRRRMW